LQMYILSVETVTKAGSLALLNDFEILQSKIGDDSDSHSINLLADIKEILCGSSVNKSEIAVLAAATGPGSFTGLRIGLSTVKGLSKALQIPAIGISILEAAVFGAGQVGVNCVVFPGSRGEVFAQNFILKDDKNIEILNAPSSERIEELIAINAHLENLNWIVTENKLSEIKNALPAQNQTFTPFPEILAGFIGQLAYRKYLINSKTFSPLNPLYVRSADVG
jgi:tRNA threonylcarbamoyladenosine biosynthesis protein TsaB